MDNELKKELKANIIGGSIVSIVFGIFGVLGIITACFAFSKSKTEGIITMVSSVIIFSYAFYQLIKIIPSCKDYKIADFEKKRVVILKKTIKSRYKTYKTYEIAAKIISSSEEIVFTTGEDFEIDEIYDIMFAKYAKNTLVYKHIKNAILTPEGTVYIRTDDTKAGTTDE